MISSRWTWWWFIACVAALIGGLAWASLQALQFERRDELVRHETMERQTLRLTMWRLESAVAPIMAKEFGRSCEDYRSFREVDREHGVRLASPLIRTPASPILLHFEIDAQSDVIRSPQIPSDDRDAALNVYTTEYEIAVAERRLRQLADRLRGLFPDFGSLAQRPLTDLNSVPESQDQDLLQEAIARNIEDFSQRAKARDEYARNDNSALKSTPQVARSIREPEMSPVAQVEDFRADWLGSGDGAILLMTRKVSIDGREFVQGFWLDVQAIKSLLLTAAGPIADRMTIAPSLESVNVDSADRRLAALPLEIQIASTPIEVVSWTPLRTTLAVTWIGAVIGVIAIGLVLRTSTELADRRGRFVSAVTHELRTPLTTFCMYTQMLSDGMVKSEEDRRQYINTLRTESQRLARIVESVLDYAKLGKRKPGNGRILTRASDFIDQTVRPLQDRCEQSGVELAVHVVGDVARAIEVDPGAVERVLYNLVDNACKYGIRTEKSLVQLDIVMSGKDLEFTVTDHGPGIERKERTRIFRPFVRGKSQVEGGVSGLGLGLALAQGLAKQMGGDLRLSPTDGGARFVFRVPIDS